MTRYRSGVLDNRLLSQTITSVSSGNLLAFNDIGSKTHEIVGDVTGNAWLLILLTMNGNEVLVAHDNTII